MREPRKVRHAQRATQLRVEDYQVLLANEDVFGVLAISHVNLDKQYTAK